MVSDASYCLFRSGSMGLAVPLDDVEEVVVPESIVRISGCPPRILGLCPYRRQVVPVVAVDEPTACLQHRQPADPTAEGSADRQAVLVLRTQEGHWGIVIHRDGTAITTSRPTRHEPKPGVGGFVSSGSIRQGESDYVLLELGPSWQALRELVVNWYAGSNDPSWSRPGP